MDLEETVHMSMGQIRLLSLEEAEEAVFRMDLLLGQGGASILDQDRI